MPFLLSLFVLHLASVHGQSGNSAEIPNNLGKEPEAENAEESPIAVHFAYSPIHLAYLAKTERQLYNLLGQYGQALLQRVDLIRRFREDYENSVVQSLQNIPESIDDWSRASFLTEHPSLVYRMMFRYSILLKGFYQNLEQGHENSVMETMEKLRGGVFWPSLLDLQDVAKGMFRLHETFGIDPVDFASGNVKDIMTNVQLTAQQCVQIAEIALILDHTFAAGEWLKAARQKIINEGDQSIPVDDFIKHWEKAVRMHGKTWNIDDVNIEDIFHESKTIIRQEYEEKKFDLNVENRIHNLRALCRGEIPPQTRQEIASRKCYNYHGNHPYFKINPVKLEIHNGENPQILELHSFIPHQAMADIGEHSFDALMIASEHKTPKEDPFFSSKTTAPTWIYDRFPSLLKAFSDLQALLSLPILGIGEGNGNGNNEFNDESEEEPFFYVQSFAVGNSYEPCLQCEEEPPEQTQRGNRVAVAELILHNTEAGGETVFTNLGITISPRRGSVLIYPDERSENQDPKRLRGTCPVLLGQKWMASRFIYENGKCYSADKFIDIPK